MGNNKFTSKKSASPLEAKSIHPAKLKSVGAMFLSFEDASTLSLAIERDNEMEKGKVVSISHEQLMKRLRKQY